MVRVCLLRSQRCGLAVPWRIGLCHRSRSSRLRDASPSFGLMGSCRVCAAYGRPSRPSPQERCETPLECVYTPFILWYLFGNHAVPPGLLGNPCGSSAFARPVGLVELALRGACSYPSSVPHRFSGVGHPVPTGLPTGLVPLAKEKVQAPGGFGESVGRPADSRAER